MSKHKLNIISKYVTLGACLCLLFTVGVVTYARLSTAGSTSESIGVAHYEVNAELYSDVDCTSEVTTLTPVDAVDIATYSETYYMKITNNGDTSVSYNLSINSPFLVNEGSSVTGYIASSGEATLTLTITTEESNTTYDTGETVTITLGLDIYQIDTIPGEGGGN